MRSGADTILTIQGRGRGVPAGLTAAMLCELVYRVYGLEALAVRQCCTFASQSWSECSISANIPG